MTKRTKERIARTLKGIRADNNLSLAQMSKILKVQPATVNHYESGRVMPPLKILERYRTKFGLDLNLLIPINEDKGGAGELR